MVNYAGISCPVLIGKETAFGTAVTPALAAGYVTSVSTSERNNFERVHALGARNAQSLVAKKFEASGSIEGTYTVSRLLAYAFGKVTTTGGAAPYVHTIEEADVLPSFTLEASMAGPSASDDVLRRYAGCAVNSIKLNWGIDAPLKFSADFLAKTVSVTELGTAGTASFDTNIVAPLAPQHATFAIGTAGAETTVLQVQSLEVTMNNNLEYIWGLGSRLAQAPVPKVRTYDVRATLAFQSSGAAGDAAREAIGRFLEGDGNSSPWTPAVTPTETPSVVITVTNGLTLANLNSLVMTFDGMQWDTLDVSEPVDGIVTVDVAGFMRGVNSTNKIVASDGLASGSYGADF